jgi:hypothetical protein
MAKEKTLVEETFIQMKNLEEAVAENAKGILASTMKQEIKDLVKESLFEQEEEEDEVETDTDVEDSETEFDTDVDNLEDDETEFSMEDPMDDSEPIDLTDPSVSNDEVLKVFQLMGPEDEVIVVKNTDGNINLKDNQTNKEYMIVQESDDDYFGEGNYSEMDEMDEYLNEFEDDDDYSDNSYGNSDLDDRLNDAFSEMDEMNDFDAEQIDEVIYELEMEEEEEGPIDFELEEMVGVDYMSDELGEDDYEAMGDMSGEYFEDDYETVMESKSFKAKGKGMGTPNKFKYSSKPNQEGGFKTEFANKKSPNKTMGTGKAKFTYKDGENLDGEFKIKPKSTKRGGETSEASRTLGAGRRFGKNGLDKPKAAPRHLRTESVNAEVTLLREKNEEYRNALNVFRDKLNEVAVFNSNLAYATRLFTEHTTTKQEKINILKRFDSVETIKESKNLYQSIKQELNKDNSSKPINESIERTIDNSPSTGSAVNLIESKTYENPQFLRMKDLMGKLK